MARVVGIDHLVIRVKDFERSKAFYDTVLGCSRLQAQVQLRQDGRLEQRQDAVLDRRGRRRRQEASAPHRQHRLPPLCLRIGQAAGRGRPLRGAAEARRDRRRPTGGLSRLRRGLLRRVLPRSRRPEARGHGVQAAAQAQACQSAKENIASDRGLALGHRQVGERMSLTRALVIRSSQCIAGRRIASDCAAAIPRRSPRRGRPGRSGPGGGPWELPPERLGRRRGGRVLRSRSGMCREIARLERKENIKFARTGGYAQPNSKSWAHRQSRGAQPSPPSRRVSAIRATAIAGVVVALRAHRGRPPEAHSPTDLSGAARVADTCWNATGAA